MPIWPCAASIRHTLVSKIHQGWLSLSIPIVLHENNTVLLRWITKDLSWNKVCSSPLWFHTCLSGSQTTPSSGVNIKLPSGNQPHLCPPSSPLTCSSGLHWGPGYCPLTATAKTPLPKCKVDILHQMLNDWKKSLGCNWKRCLSNWMLLAQSHHNTIVSQFISGYFNNIQ